MAKYSSNTSMPVDTPISIAPGVTHRETDFQGDAKFGFVQSEDGTIEGRLKGDRGWQDLNTSMPRIAVNGGSPFANLKSGRGDGT